MDKNYVNLGFPLQALSDVPVNRRHLVCCAKNSVTPASCRHAAGTAGRHFSCYGVSPSDMSHWAPSPTTRSPSGRRIKVGRAALPRPRCPNSTRRLTGRSDQPPVLGPAKLHLPAIWLCLFGRNVSLHGIAGRGSGMKQVEFVCKGLGCRVRLAIADSVLRTAQATQSGRLVHGAVSQY